MQRTIMLYTKSYHNYTVVLFMYNFSYVFYTKLDEQFLIEAHVCLKLCIMEC